MKTKTRRQHTVVPANIVNTDEQDDQVHHHNEKMLQYYFHNSLDPNEAP